MLSCGSAAAIALSLCLIRIKVWNADLAVPFEYHQDSVSKLGQAKSLLENGNPFTNPSLGAPYGQQLFDFYQGELLQQSLLFLPGLWSDNPALIVNLVWLAGFPIIAASAWWAMHSLGLSRAMSLTGAVLFSLLPYHFWRGETHPYLSAYFVVPLAGWLIIQVLRGTPFLSRSGNRWGLAGAIAICLAIGLSGVYYSVLAMSLLVFASLVSLISPNSRRAAGHGLIATGLISLALLLSFSPALIHQSDHGKNPLVAARTVTESEMFGLSLAQLVLPATNHRMDQLAELKAEYLGDTIAPSEDSQSLGLLGTAGLIWIVMVALASTRGRPKWTRELEVQSGVAALLAFMVATIGGISVLFALAVTPKIRGWDRMSIYIGFFALIGFASLLSRLDERLLKMKRGALLSAGFIALVLLFGLWDQTPTRWPNQFDHEELQQQYSQDSAFLQEVDASYPEDSMIFQIPYVNFPEGTPPGTMDRYDPMKAYIHSDDLRWSFGAMNGRAADIGVCVHELPLQKLVPVISAWGFAGLWIDLAGYEPDQRRQVLSSARKATGSRPLRGEDSRIAVFDLSGVTVRSGYKEDLRTALPDDGADLLDCEPIRETIR